MDTIINFIHWNLSNNLKIYCIYESWQLEYYVLKDVDDIENYGYNEYDIDDNRYKRWHIGWRTVDKNGVWLRKQCLPIFLHFSRLTHSASFLYDGIKLSCFAVWWFKSFLSFWYYTYISECSDTEEKENGEDDEDVDGLNGYDVTQMIIKKMSKLERQSQQE